MQDLTNDIFKKASEGDLKAFETVYKAASGFVYNVALRVAQNREDAEEITQEVFMILYHKLKSFRFESSFETWVYRITANCAINFAKKYSKIRSKTTEYEDTMMAAPASDDVQSHIDKEHHHKVLEDLLNALNPEQRMCVVLRNMEGLSYQEIAEAMSININTVRSRLKRAREKLLHLKRQVVYEHL